MKKIICNKCGAKIESKLDNKSLKMMGIRKRTNYPFGKKSKGVTTLFCSCGGVFVGE